MRKSFLVIFFATIGLLSFGQIVKPISWTFSSRNTGVGESELVFTATVNQGWHIYSQYTNADGPVPTSFSLDKSDDFEIVGKIKENGKLVKEFQKEFGVEVSYFSNKVIFVQKIKLTKPSITVSGSVNFMACNDHECLPPDDVSFKIKVKNDKMAVSAAAVVAETTAPVKPDTAKGTTVVAQHPDSQKVQAKIQVDSLKTTVQAPAKDDIPTSLWAIFIIGFFGGFAAFVMPCIFPMVPMTVSYFTKKEVSKSKGVIHALIYGLSIIFIYVVLGLLITIIFGSDALNALSTNGVFNLFFFLLLVVFALSFLGAFELVLPSSWVNKADSKSSKDNLTGIFFMALTLALVSFSCTGPIIGGILVQVASSGQYLGPAIGMLGFSLALAIPFVLFAMFPTWLKSLPKSGGWLNSVKVVLGFLELAFAFKFLSNVDLAYHWNWFDREVFLSLWIVISALLGFYLLGKLKLPNDSMLDHISTPRLILAIITLSFTIYMVPGLWGAPLKSISAFLPPMSTQDFVMSKSEASETVQTSKHKYGNIFKPSSLGIDLFFDYDEGMAYARKVKRPVFIDFTGHTCVNCRKMEESVWPDKMVLKYLKDDFVVIQLYVDDKTDLEEHEQFVSKFSGKSIKTIGSKWSDFQASRFNTNSQPFYVLLDTEGNMLVKPQGANYDPALFAGYLNSGVEAFKSK